MRFSDGVGTAWDGINALPVAQVDGTTGISPQGGNTDCDPE
jgi:hypothetical protein